MSSWRSWNMTSASIALPSVRQTKESVLPDLTITRSRFGLAQGGLGRSALLGASLPPCSDVTWNFTHLNKCINAYVPSKNDLKKYLHYKFIIVLTGQQVQPNHSAHLPGSDLKSHLVYAGDSALLFLVLATAATAAVAFLFGMSMLLSTRSPLRI